MLPASAETNCSRSTTSAYPPKSIAGRLNSSHSHNTMSNLTVGKKTNLAIASSYVLIAIIGCLLYLNTTKFIQTQEWVAHTNKVTGNMTQLLATLVNMETGVRGYAVGGEEKFLEPYHANRTEFDRLLTATKELVNDNPAQVARLTRLGEAEAQWVASDVAPTLEARRAANQDATQLATFVATFNQAKGKAQMDAMRAQIAEITGIEQSLMATRERAFVAASRASKLWITVGLPVAMATGLILLVWVVRGVVRSITVTAGVLNDGANQVASAASQVSGSSQTLAEGANEQAASLEETSSSLEEMASMTSRNTENAEKANELAREARLAADTGAGDMTAMTAAMNEIKTSADDIAKIIKTIDEIAFQTNILALNAAVEAARAGEAGAGFAVVADEVRNLAQRAAQSAKETSVKIENALTKTAQGVQLTDKVARSLQEIVTKVREVDTLVAEVASASKEQTQGIQQVNGAVGQMDKVTQANAANAEESASAAEELNAQAVSLKEAVASLLSLVSASASREQPASSTTIRPVASRTLGIDPKAARATADHRQAMVAHVVGATRPGPSGADNFRDL